MVCLFVWRCLRPPVWGCLLDWHYLDPASVGCLPVYVELTAVSNLAVRDCLAVSVYLFGTVYALRLWGAWLHGTACTVWRSGVRSQGFPRTALFHQPYAARTGASPPSSVSVPYAWRRTSSMFRVRTEAAEKRKKKKEEVLMLGNRAGGRSRDPSLGYQYF